MTANPQSAGTGGQARDFPAEFLWGSSTAAHQVEGGNVNNDWWAWEHTPGTSAVESSGDAIDTYHRYDDDFRLLAELGQNSHRWSLEWSRIEPAEGEFSTAALAHYRRMLESLHGHGLTPLTTLHHFTVPRWFAERGSWLAGDAVDIFGRYVERVAAALGDLMPWVCTINEPQIIALIGYRIGRFPPGVRDDRQWQAAGAALLRAHERAVEIVGGSGHRSRSGICLQLPALEPADPEDPRSSAAYEQVRAEMYDRYLGGLTGDFVGVQYYTRMRISADGTEPPAPGRARTTLMGWEVHPAGLRQAIDAAAATGLPVLVTENGIATDDDNWRIDFIEAHLDVVRQALADGVDLRGFTYWSSFDNFEWADGYRPTFGLVGVDRAGGQRRIVRPSAHAYGRVARSGRLAALREG